MFGKKRAFINNWWIATRDDKMKFVNIANINKLPEDAIIVGYIDGPVPQLGKSHNPVVKIKRNGVLTKSGRFYPFKTAHPVYLMFLDKVNSEKNIVIASKWKYSKNYDNEIIANIEYSDGTVYKDVCFDFKTLYDSWIAFYGYSELFESNVVINTFDRRGKYVGLKVLPDVYADIYDTSDGLEEDKTELVKNVKKVLRNNR